MAKLESSLKNMLLSLTFITLGAAALLAGGYAITKKPIEQAEAAKKDNAIKAVLPVKDATLADPVSITLSDRAEPFIIYPALKDGKMVAAAIQTYCTEGYGGRIELMIGLTADGTIVDYSVLSAAETPGLGAKMVDWFKSEKGDRSIKGKSLTTTKFEVKKDGGDIDAITASTISSRAFLKAVRDAFAAFDEYKNKE
jgi:electron transport complex protein RnfG